MFVFSLSEHTDNCFLRKLMNSAFNIPSALAFLLLIIVSQICLSPEKEKLRPEEIKFGQ